MKQNKLFILNPDKYLLPSYLLSPFNTAYISTNATATTHEVAKAYMEKRFKDRFYYICRNGRQAIDVSLKACALRSKDNITILTTSGNRYISKCVTDTIERYCQWSRRMMPQTKIIFVNHEFGYECKTSPKINKEKVIIEDYAYSFFLNENVAYSADYAIYSLPKVFPMQTGGILVTKKALASPPEIHEHERNYILSCMSKYIADIPHIVAKRLANCRYLAKELKSIGIQPFFDINNSVPGVFLFYTLKGIHLEKFKTYMNAHGIQSSVFYGQNAYFIPVHQNLNKYDLDYFVEVIKNYKNNE